MIYSGTNEMAIAGLSFGADGLLGSFYNLIPEVYLKLLEAFKSGDAKTAKRLQENVNAIIFFALMR